MSRNTEEAMAQARRVVTMARLYKLLARRPEFARHERAHRVRHALTADAPGPLPLLDAAQVACADELDLLCGYAVRVLGRPRNASPASVALLDVLGVLSPERVAAIYWALPTQRRRAVTRDAVFAYTVQGRHADFAAAEGELDSLVADTPNTDLTYEIARMAFALEAS